MFKNVLGIIFTLLCLSCGFGGKEPAADADRTPPQPPSPTSWELPQPLHNFSANSANITIMTWNVENLYDAVDDPKKLDDTYLPLALKTQIPNHFENCKKLDAKSWQKQCIEWDWTDFVVQEKLRKMAQVILSVNSGGGPDFLALQEVENIELLQRLIDDFLPQRGYRAYLIENNDARGIDVGVITRLKLAGSPRLIRLGGSRPALQMNVILPDTNQLSMTVVHFPIAASPLKKRLGMLNQLTKNPDNGLQIILGDFNFPRKEMEDSQIAQNHLLPKWIPAHLYCKTCTGTTYETFTRDWSFLDMILLNQKFFSATTPWTVNISSFNIHNPLTFQTNVYGSPADYFLPSLRGVSDHWPLLIQLVKTE
jgi:Endonuclease/Exonuclease/phosphatase family